MTYPVIEPLELRTDVSFRTQSNAEHHHGNTPLCELTIDMIKHFPIDYMHQVCLGVQKKLLLAWIRGKKEFRISAVQVKEISQHLVNLQRFIPNVFARKPRSLDEVDRWKATEYRQFLLYTGKIVLKGILRRELYEHFMCLSVAISILVCPRLIEEHSQYAHKLLTYFVSKSVELYGQEFLVYNVHSLTHLTSDAEEYGGLDMCSAFPFENYLQQLKRMVRSSKNPVVQITRRLQESQKSESYAFPGDRKVSAKRPNNVYMISKTAYCEVVSISNQKDGTDKKLLCRVYEGGESLFHHPCDSRLIGVCLTHIRNAHMRLLPKHKLDKQAILIERDQGKCFWQFCMTCDIR